MNLKHELVACPCVKEGQPRPGLGWQECNHQVEGSASPCSVLIRLHRELRGPVLGSSVQGRYIPARASPAGVHHDD